VSLDGRLDFGACAQRRACIVAGAGGAAGRCVGCGVPGHIVLAKLVRVFDQVLVLVPKGVEW
jgi:hypothetical protein